ncbi:hypothetical protein PR048_028129 [Dryococelus australis]|uniref:Uncharacterized protein n=1 Tax=Dryococelus australis TaxID=614101 RepID=A0ABQ9GIF9_9NEOP|nr:hypothetical protein PR048_028129 [Dryococelus australis]
MTRMASSLRVVFEQLYVDKTAHFSVFWRRIRKFTGVRTGFNARPDHSRIFASGNRAGRCRWSADFLGDLASPPPPLRPLHSGAAPFSPRFTLIGSQDLVVKSRPNLSPQWPSTELGWGGKAEKSLELMGVVWICDYLVLRSGGCLDFVMNRVVVTLDGVVRLVSLLLKEVEGWWKAHVPQRELFLRRDPLGLIILFAFAVDCNFGRTSLLRRSRMNKVFLVRYAAKQPPVTAIITKVLPETSVVTSRGQEEKKTPIFRVFATGSRGYVMDSPIAHAVEPPACRDLNSASRFARHTAMSAAQLGPRLATPVGTIVWGVGRAWPKHSTPIKANRVRFPHVGIVPDDAVSYRVFSGISRIPRHYVPDSPMSAFKKLVQTSSLTHSTNYLHTEGYRVGYSTYLSTPGGVGRQVEAWFPHRDQLIDLTRTRVCPPPPPIPTPLRPLGKWPACVAWRRCDASTTSSGCDCTAKTISATYGVSTPDVANSGGAG